MTASVIAAGAIDYAQLLEQNLGDLDIFDHRNHVGNVTGADLAERVTRRAGALQAKGVRRGDRIVMVATNTESYLTTLLAVLALGAIPCAVAPPPAPSQESSAGVRHLSAAVEVIEPRFVIAEERDIAAVAHPAPLSYTELTETQPVPWHPVTLPEPGDIHHIQLTSGSTSAPKAVVLSHGNVAHNIGALSRSMGEVAGGRMFSWLPMYHDMGFIQVLGALVHGSPIGLMSPLAFLRDPMSWMRHMSAHGSTVSAGPPFAYRAVTAALGRLATAPDLDLSALGHLFVGAEPIPYPVLRDFTEAFAPFGLRSDVLVPCYGMAESVLASTLALTIAPSGPMNFGRVRVRHHSPTGSPVVGCGGPIDGLDIRILGANGSPAEPGTPGEIILRGPSVMLGYRGADGRITPDPGGWHHTGDLGVLDDGELFVIGRTKEMVIIRGRNYPPYDIEQAIETLETIESSAVFSVTDDHGAESVIAVVGARPGADPDGLRTEVEATVRRIFGFSLDDVVIVRRGQLPRTSSGKLQRTKIRDLYLSGGL